VSDIRRREFITLLGGAAVTWPVAARAQQPTIPVVGYVHSDSPQTVASLLAAFREGLSETGYVEGQNVAIEYRWAQNDLSRIPGKLAPMVIGDCCDTRRFCARGIEDAKSAVTEASHAILVRPSLQECSQGCIPS
jgi:hypothetical protein